MVEDDPDAREGLDHVRLFQAQKAVRDPAAPGQAGMEAYEDHKCGRIGQQQYMIHTVPAFCTG
jgi:hypothetical protein